MSIALAAQALAPAVDVVIDSPEWAAEPDAEALVRRAIEEAAVSASLEHESEVAVALSDDATLRALNHQWRGIDKATNVLSFPSAPPAPGRKLVHLGDIAIAYETTAREAREEGKTFANHLSHLAVHGFLHLVGYDHEVESDAEKMERLERAILARLGIPDPYLTPDTEA